LLLAFKTNEQFCFFYISIAVGVDAPWLWLVQDGNDTFATADRAAAVV
jgi:hypothetical protein